MVDSLAAASILRQRRVGGLPVRAFVDLGSGGGYPGIPLAAALPVEQVLLVDSVGKKAAFLAAAVLATGLDSRVAVASERAESLARDSRHRERWQAVTARAVGGLDELVELSFPLLVPGGILIAWKRGDIEDEIGAARLALASLGGGRIDTLLVEAKVVIYFDQRLSLVRKEGVRIFEFVTDNDNII